MVSPDPNLPLAVLISGGLDSAVLLGMAAQTHPVVYPLYIRTGLAWEDDERRCLERFLAELPSTTIRPLVTLEMPVSDLYGDHWSTRGTAPNAIAADEEFYLPGRNVLLLAKSLIWCRLHNVPAIALAVLAANPFPDASASFFREYASVVSGAVGGQVTIVTPFSGLTKAEVIRRGANLPLQHTLSCMSPANGRHCGACGKCAERGRAFIAAGVPDPTNYLSRAWEGTTQKLPDVRPWE